MHFLDHSIYKFSLNIFLDVGVPGAFLNDGVANDYGRVRLYDRIKTDENPQWKK